MTQINDGGPAFPSEQGHIPDGTWNQSYSPGMTLRDWFAGQVIGAIFTRPNTSQESAAREAYQIADAMIAAREAKP